MEESNRQTQGPLETLAGIADQFTLLKAVKLSTEVKIKFNSEDYMALIREVENMTNVGADPMLGQAPKLCFFFRNRQIVNRAL